MTGAIKVAFVSASELSYSAKMCRMICVTVTGARCTAAASASACLCSVFCAWLPGACAAHRYPWSSLLSRWQVQWCWCFDFSLPVQHLLTRGRHKYLHQTHILVILCIYSTNHERLQAQLKHHSSRSAFCNVLLQVLIEDAEFLMNRVAAGELSWDDVRPQIAEKYEQAGLREVAEFANAVQ